MSSKLELINTCLALTGNLLVNVEDDGGPEWVVSSSAYEAGIKYLLGSKNWGFGTAVVTLNRKGSSTDPSYTDVYHRPAGSLGLSWVKVDGLAVEWTVIGNDVYLCAPNGGVQAKHVLRPEPEAIPPLFEEALICLVKAGCYEGLNEDQSSAAAQRAEAEAKIALARSRNDQEGSNRRKFRSTMLDARYGVIERSPR